MYRRLAVAAALLAVVVLGPPPGSRIDAAGAGPIVTPEKFLGYPVGADNKLARWTRSSST